MMIPETDWTWVLQRPCPECGLDTRSFAREDIPAIISANAASWQQALTVSAGPAAGPARGTWSPTEYACHVRDLLVLCDYRLGLKRTICANSGRGVIGGMGAFQSCPIWCAMCKF
jgi:hypothetical protein